MVPEGGASIAEVRTAWFRAHVVTRYRARTSVERWQIQDRIAVRLARMGQRSRPRFYEMADGRLAFTLWTGIQSSTELLDRLRSIDGDDGDG